MGWEGRGRSVSFETRVLELLIEASKVSVRERVFSLVWVRRNTFVSPIFLNPE